MEIWKDIKDYEGYQVSNQGRVRSFDRVIETKKGLRKLKGKFLKVYKDRYITVQLYKVKSPVLLHRFIALAFIPNPENKREINHIDGDKHNNSTSNLEWCTSTENKNHAYKMGLKKCPNGDLHWCTKIPDKEIEKIRNRHSKGETQASIASEYNVWPQLISGIVNFKSRTL